MQTEERANKTILRKKNIMTIPRDIADRMHLAEGGEFNIRDRRGGPDRADPGPARPGGPGLVLDADPGRRASPRAEADRIAGSTTVYGSEDEFLAALDEN